MSAPPGDVSPADLARAGFTRTSRSARVIADVVALLGQRSAELDVPALVGDLGAVADPDAAALAVVRLVEKSRDAATLMLHPGPQRDRVLRVLGASTALSDHLVKHPEHLDDAADPNRARPEAVVESVRGLSGREGAEALRVAYRQQVVRIAATDLSAQDPLQIMPEVASALADLAGAAVEAALWLARAEVEDQEQARVTVVGMGKCGGRELNYISDVDVIFLAAPVDGADEEEAMRVAGRIASTLMRICGEATAEGSLWPVDAALRPEGKNGPLVRSMVSHREYYERWAQSWEFQALLKARVIAGDAELGQEWLDVVQPLVWDAGSREGFVDDVRAMRRRVEESVPAARSDRQLKLGAGGLRDIEFSVQLLQMVHGRADSSVRSGTTLEALAALRDGAYVGREDAAALDQAYRLLRSLEHRIQLHKLRRNHMMPDSQDELRRLGRSLGEHSDAEGAIVQRWRAQQREVRRLHERLFYRPLLAAVARLSSDSLRLSPEAARDRLSALGFRDPPGALRHLESLTEGVSRRATIQRTLLPVMLSWFADGADPDAGLLAFRQISDALGTTHWYLAMLRDEGSAAQRLATILSSSRYAVDLLLRSPESVALLGNPADLAPPGREALDGRFSAAEQRQEHAGDAYHAIRAVRAKELVRLVLADLVGDLSPTRTREALTDLTDAYLSAALNVARRDGGDAVEMIVVGMGRLGGRELGYASDADVMYCYRAREGDPEDEQERQAGQIAAQIVADMRKGLSGHGPDPTLELDADLRPEGRSGPLVRSIESYRAYYERWSAGWEAQALLRARVVAGEESLAADFTRMVDPLRWPAAGLDEQGMRAIRKLKARMEAERLPKGADPRTHFKLGLGGLTDVEWVAQTMQLQHAHRVPGLRTTSTVEALQQAVSAELLSPADERSLAAAWTLGSRLRDAGVLWRGRPVESVPSDHRDAEGISRILGRPRGSGAGLAQKWRQTARQCRSVVERLFYGEGQPIRASPRRPGPRRS
ncbi:MAG TPA: bifunctional [glutamine synthetase] adenylyltransferase/[glutamine synthetase]-adenylyl-L-tyrosine phosphorylase [Ornithinimicrobium sp.]|uniref:bifunctional [glutamine synthetase] adenylyltransferase/[glutamine synthetase]-adenylyl-L-tyrosine phosphorylase n=1 Tax=Ornithinimicrobium sp. TaxID=1977084 RepID=UPI002B478B4E|nr:bifunctional [glutamine synthetase] adenylyltransferase/[glutamine synthetase]-adenylyl-L-tyrosine phosphorylase [Ornithinimicrobium sp.]HKJ12056.1 bifunctional [glutamine synthetase] adenylyltransferase/[glutamine synthetase]-adenylyl-L-tyrosine phosphorylase [Ornithinimicrobium sp.]